MQNQTTPLPKSLREIVRLSIDLLGETIKEVYGPKSFQLIENIRKDMVNLRSANLDNSYNCLSKYRKKFTKISDTELAQINHAFSLYMELINRCERAYRSHRLNENKNIDIPKHVPYSIIFVFTAHPTEARSQAMLNLMREIEAVLIERLHETDELQIKRIKNILGLALQVNLSETQKPQVRDEAKNIFEVTLGEKILDRQVHLLNTGVNVQFRTWVGGDKDGHPYVNEKTMLESWNLSREYLLNYINLKTETVLKRVSPIQSKEILKLQKSIKSFQSSLKTLLPLKKGDGTRVKEIRKLLEALKKTYGSIVKTESNELNDISQVLWLYPALVMPLEIREDSELVHQALKQDMPISQMLKKLKEISQGELCKWYVRGFVLSMCQTVEDLEAGEKLTNKVLGDYLIPVVPLFETQAALENSQDILKTFFEKNKKLLKVHKSRWGSRFEIMLGYSDSSKESGVFTSRLLIASTLNKLTPFFKNLDLTPVFFHGSGGSIERGGGSIKEQTGYWPKEALNIFKSTIQGEMVPRNFGNHLILNSMIKKIVQNFSEFKVEKSQVNSLKNKLFEEFSESVTNKYQSFIKDENFIEFLSSATPYNYLDQLKIGSRPTKRTTGSKEIKLRAIPWVLCWTQTRILFPTWWGVGSTWSEWPGEKKYEFMRLAPDNKFLQTYVKILGFSLAKIELPILKLYLEENLSKDRSEYYFKQFVNEYEKTKQFFQELSGHTEFLWFRPWLQESIKMRSTMIHPLNLIQLESLRRKNSALLRESVTGISCGMLTTG